jgi:hypothetical protein
MRKLVSLCHWSEYFLLYLPEQAQVNKGSEGANNGGQSEPVDEGKSSVCKWAR